VLNITIAAMVMIGEPTSRPDPNSRDKTQWVCTRARPYLVPDALRHELASQEVPERRSDEDRAEHEGRRRQDCLRATKVLEVSPEIGACTRV
jgi:hypothetical protein